jgi:phenylalanyl-tRNA synthetase beta chain
MKVSSSWINQWLRRTMLHTEIVTALESAGIEVEHISSSGPLDKNILVALVKEVIQHPQADRLKIAKVWTGEREYSVVCGAPNVREGLKAAFAQIGTKLPSGDKILRAKLRGVESEGMLCSAKELGLGEDHNGLLELDDDAEVGQPLCDIYRPDAVIDIKTPANRWDVMSVSGLAREVSAFAGAPMAPLPSAISPSSEEIAIEPDTASSRYMLASVEVQAQVSPPEVQARLRSIGSRPVSFVVDVTNYVMFDLGQPLHAYDADKVTLPVGVRLARAGEELVTLDGVKRTLSSEDLVVVDADGPIALAGVMGGRATEVSASTRRILLEAAVFDPVRVRKTAQRHGLRTEASARCRCNWLLSPFKKLCRCWMGAC